MSNVTPPTTIFPGHSTTNHFKARVSPGKHLRRPAIFALKTKSGDWARMRNGQRFIYSSRVTAKIAALHLFKTHGRLSVTEA